MIVTCRSVTLARVGVGTANSWNSVRVRIKVRGMLSRVLSHVLSQNSERVNPPLNT